MLMVESILIEFRIVYSTKYLGKIFYLISCFARLDILLK